MKKLLIAIPSLAFASVLALATPAHADIKVGVVDMNKIFQSYWKTKDAENKINEQKNAAQGEFNSRMENYRKSLEDIQQLNKELENKAISQSAKEDRTKKRDQKIQESQQQQHELQNFQQSRERQIQEQILRERDHIVDEIMKLIKDRVQTDNFDLVFDKSGNSSSMVPVVLYSRDNMDFSEDIIRTLNKNKPADAPATTAPSSSSSDHSSQLLNPAMGTNSAPSATSGGNNPANVPAAPPAPPAAPSTKKH